MIHWQLLQMIWNILMNNNIILELQLLLKNKPDEEKIFILQQLGRYVNAQLNAISSRQEVNNIERIKK